MKRIYLISDTGCAYTNDKQAASLLCRVGGFRIVTRQEYEARMAQIKGSQAVAAIGRIQRRERDG